MFAEERQAEIAELVLTTRRVNGADLARRFDVTMETVRRDLAALEAAGRLRRVHGGAVSADQSTSDEKAISSRKHLNTPEKRRIAQAAFDLLRTSGAGAVVLDAGSTVEALADLIARTDSTLPDGQEQLIITHALHIAAKLADGARLACTADWGVSTTGVAGPEPPDGHPVGTVFVGVSGPGGTEVRPLRLQGTRDRIRADAVSAALEALVRRLRQD